MPAVDKVIGRCRCPVCSGTRASLRVSAKQLAYVICNGCNSQVFARSDASDERLRALLIAEPAAPAPAPEPAPEPVRTSVAPAPAPVRTAEPPEPPQEGWLPAWLK